MGNLVNKGLAFLTIPIFTRILSTSDYGIVNTYISWVSILSVCISLALYMGIRSAFIDYINDIDSFVSSITVFVILVFISVSIVILSIIFIFHIDVDILLVSLCLMQSFACAIIENYSMYLMMKFKYINRTVLMVLPNLISVFLSIFTITMLLNEKYFIGRIIPTSLIFFITSLFLLYRIFKKSRKFKAEYIIYGLTISAPLVLHGIALSILSQSDRSMITWLADSNQTGIYSLVYNFSMVATVLTTTLDGVWIPWFTEKMKIHSKDDLDNINSVAKDYVYLMTFAIITVILISPEILKMMSSKEYWGGICVIPPIVASNYIIFLYTLYVNIEHFYKKTIRISINTIIAALINIILNFILIPVFGYIAAAYTTLTAYTVALVLHAFYSKKIEPDLYNIKMFVVPMLEVILFTVLYYCFSDNWYIRWGTCIIYLAIMALKYRDKLKKYLWKV